MQHQASVKTCCVCFAPSYDICSANLSQLELIKLQKHISCLLERKEKTRRYVEEFSTIFDHTHSIHNKPPHNLRAYVLLMNKHRQTN